MAVNTKNRDLDAELLRLTVDVSDSAMSLADRRRLFLEGLGGVLEAAAGLWAWGTGTPGSSRPQTIAGMHFGLNDAEVTRMQQFTMSEEAYVHFQMPLMARIGPDGVLCAPRRTLFSDESWMENNWVRQSLKEIGKDEWMHSVRYGSDHKWSALLLMRDIGQPAFDDDESRVMRRAIANVKWLWSGTADLPQSQDHAASHVTARQRTVLWMLLSGMSRKAIAKQLGISEDTVGNHIKALFDHYGVESAIELAAIFLQSH